jgi:hypothetical protein
VARDFQEVQYLAWWAALILAGTGILLPILFLTFRRIWTVLSLAIFLGFGVMTTDVTSTEVRVQFGWIPAYKETIAIREIRSAQPVQYDPADYGGWGIRARSASDRVLSQRGERAVQLQLEGGRQLLIGSQAPDALAKAIEPFRAPTDARP